MFEIHETATFRKWRRKLRDERAKARIAARIFRLANSQPGDVKPIGEGISELRIDYGPGYRVYFKRSGNAIIFLLCGGAKDSQRRDVAKAKQLAKRGSTKHE